MCPKGGYGPGDLGWLPVGLRGSRCGLLCRPCARSGAEGSWLSLRMPCLSWSVWQGARLGFPGWWQQRWWVRVPLPPVVWSLSGCTFSLSLTRRLPPYTLLLGLG